MALRRRRLLGFEAEVLGSFIALTLLSSLFIVITSKMLAGDTLAWDRSILRAMRSPELSSVPLGPPWLHRWMLDITTLGGGPFLTLLTIIVAGFLFVTFRRGMAMFVLASTIGGSVLGTLLKTYFVRARPDVVPHLVEVHSMSFPSAHAFNSAVIYLTLGGLVAATEKRRAVRVYVLGSALLLTVAVGLSRVYLGVHYPSDVLAGWCAGAAWAAGCASFARWLQQRDGLETSTSDGTRGGL